MRRLSRFCGMWRDGMRVMWGCDANLLVKIAAIPAMMVIAALCAIMDMIDGNGVE